MVGNYGGASLGTSGGTEEERSGGNMPQDVEKNTVEGSTKPGELSKDDLVELYRESIINSPDSIEKYLKSDDNKEVIFTLYNLLHVGFTNKEKESVKWSKNNNEPVDEEIADYLTEGLINAIRHNGLMSSVLRDPFMRSLRVELSDNDGKLWSDEPSREKQNEIIKFLWGLDEGFYAGESAKGLIKNKALRILGRQNAERYGGLIGKLIKKGEVTLPQLAHDPLLREEHFKNLLELETGEGSYSEIEATLWSLDEGFTESKDYYKMMKKRISERPEIYEHPDKTEIDRLTDSVVQGISADKVMNIMANYRENMRSGDEELRRILLEAVGFRDKNNLPEIEYSKLRGGEEGRYDWRNNKIIIDEDGIRNGLVRSSISFVDEEDLLVNNNPRMNNNDELIRRRIDVIAQEIWHACEWRGNLVDNERGRMYKENFVYYVDGGDNEFSSREYRSQLIEAEARTFAGKVINLIRRANFVSKFAAQTMDLIHGTRKSDSNSEH